jgi:hypothetical protein
VLCCAAQALQLDGALHIAVAEGAEAVVDGLVVSNAGWEWKPLAEGTGTEEQSIRGFSVVKHETEELVVTETAPAAAQRPWWLPRCLLGY